MNWIDKLERKYGKYGIQNLTVYMIVCYVAGYVLQNISPAIMSMLNLEPYRILHGQVWRLITWVISPPGNSNVFLFALMVLFFYYPIGTSLERTWGSFRYTLYILSGILFTVLGAFLVYAITGATFGIGYLFSTYYISLSIFLAYAMSYPDMQILLWFVIPIKMKWMAIVYGLIVAYDMIRYIRVGLWYMAIPIAASLLNFVIFYLSSKNLYRYNPKEVRRRREFKQAMSQGQARSQGGTGSWGGAAVSKHKCAICGRTELDHPELEFRFCSKCNGNYEYCQDHLFTHTHVK